MGWRASRDHGEAVGGAVVDREGLEWFAHGEHGVSPEKNTGGDGVPKLGVKCTCKREQNGGRGSY
jgi:hypothetical protein